MKPWKTIKEKLLKVSSVKRQEDENKNNNIGIWTR